MRVNRGSFPDSAAPTSPGSQPTVAPCSDLKFLRCEARLMRMGGGPGADPSPDLDFPPTRWAVRAVESETDSAAERRWAAMLAGLA